MKIPKSLQAELPFASKPKLMKPAKRQSYLAKRAVLLEPEEKKIYTLMQQLNSIRSEKDKKRKLKDAERREEHLKKKAKLEEERLQKEKKRRSEYFKKEQMKQSNKK